jgi:hypothetical protein
MAVNETVNKAALLAGLMEVRRKILAEASALPAKSRNAAYLGTWSVKDMLAHLAGWDDTNLRAVKSVLAGRLPRFYTRWDRDWAAYNAWLVAKYKCEPYKKLLASVKETRRRLIDFLESVPPEAFGKDFGVRFRGIRVTIQRLLEAETGDERLHYEQILKFAREKE